ncbi:MAG: exodeoxyribonuclease VII small subunit [Treponemataceae bacterium]|nr:exodeoxyribonuclease VII small subunit [Treponemataceae bacterium]
MTFEEKLAHLEQLTSDIKRSDISLEDALRNFEEGIKLARGMEKEIEKIEGRIQQLVNQPDAAAGVPPELDLFSGLDGGTGSSGAPEQGTRQ